MIDLTGAAPDNGELVITRVFDAPRELVFRAWTDPVQSARWFGPRTVTACDHDFDVRPGGKWRVRLKPLDGSGDLWLSGIYQEIDEPARLVFTFAWDDNGPKNEMLVTLSFEEHEGKTRMRLHQTRFASLEQRDEHGWGWNSSLDRLGEYLENDSSV